MRVLHLILINLGVLFLHEKQTKQPNYFAPRRSCTMGPQEGSRGRGTCFRDDTQARSGSILPGPNPSPCGDFQRVSRRLFTTAGVLPLTSAYAMLYLLPCNQGKWMTPHQTTGSQRQKFPGIADMTLFVPLISNDFFFFFHLLLTPHWVWYFHHTQVRRPGVNVPIATPPIGLSRGPAPGVVCIGAPITACHHFNK